MTQAEAKLIQSIIYLKLHNLCIQNMFAQNNFFFSRAKFEISTIPQLNPFKRDPSIICMSNVSISFYLSVSVYASLSLSPSRFWTCGRTRTWWCRPSRWTEEPSGTTSTSPCRTSCGWPGPRLPLWLLLEEVSRCKPNTFFNADAYSNTAAVLLLKSELWWRSNYNSSSTPPHPRGRSSPQLAFLPDRLIYYNYGLHTS